MKSVVVDPSLYEWEKRPSTPQVVLADNRVRDACAGIHEGSKLRSCQRRRVAPTSGVIEKDTIPAGTRSHGGRAHAGVPVRRTRLPDRARPITGVTHRSRSSRRTRRTARGRDPLGPVDEFPRHGESTAPGRHRSDSWTSCSTTRPKAMITVRRCVSAASRTGLTTCLRDRNFGTQTIPAVANTLNANHPVVRRLIEGQPALLGAGDAHRRLPIRPRLSPVGAT